VAHEVDNCAFRRCNGVHELPVGNHRRHFRRPRDLRAQTLIRY
jgi:hypothetical protein